MYGNSYNPTSLNNIDAQIENLTRLKNQMQPQSPITNVINTNSKVELEARILKDGESIENILISNKTMFLDKAKGIVAIKETNGDISETYQIIIPKDPKDEKIEKLEAMILNMEDKLNEYANVTTNNEIEQSNGNGSKSNKK